MVDVVHEPIGDEQADMYIWPPVDFYGIGLQHAVPIHPIFEPCPLNENITRWWYGHSWSHLSVLEYNDVDHCGLMCLNDLLQTPKIFLNKTILHKTKKTFFVCSLRWHCPHTRHKCFWPRPLLSPLYWTPKEEYVGNDPISPLGTPFSSVHRFTH